MPPLLMVAVVWLVDLWTWTAPSFACLLPVALCVVVCWAGEGGGWGGSVKLWLIFVVVDLLGKAWCVCVYCPGTRVSKQAGRVRQQMGPGWGFAFAYRPPTGTQAERPQWAPRSKIHPCLA